MKDYRTAWLRTPLALVMEVNGHPEPFVAADAFEATVAVVDPDEAPVVARLANPTGGNPDSEYRMVGGRLFRSMEDLWGNRPDASSAISAPCLCLDAPRLPEADARPFLASRFNATKTALKPSSEYRKRGRVAAFDGTDDARARVAAAGGDMAYVGDVLFHAARAPCLAFVRPGRGTPEARLVAVAPERAYLEDALFDARLPAGEVMERLAAAMGFDPRLAPAGPTGLVSLEPGALPDTARTDAARHVAGTVAHSMSLLESRLPRATERAVEGLYEAVEAGDLARAERAMAALAASAPTDPWERHTSGGRDAAAIAASCQASVALNGFLDEMLDDLAASEEAAAYAAGF